MALQSILIFTVVSLVIRVVGKGEWRKWLILGVSAVVIFWLQPEIPARYAAYWLPLVTIAIVILCWLVVTPKEVREKKENYVAAVVLLGLAALIGISRYFSTIGLNIPILFNPPPLHQIVIFLLALVGLFYLVRFFSAKVSFLPLVFILGIVFLFIWLKTPYLEQVVIRWLRGLAGQSTDISHLSDAGLRWLGFSYIAFRLLHTLRDRQGNRLPVVTLRDYACYVLFFPSLAAGPIDRIQHFLNDYQKPPADLAGDLIYSGRRLMIGLFKKFVLADAFALISLSPTNAINLDSTVWAWVVVYAYGFQIYLDFSGYTDMAIAIGRLLGVQLPENFKSPYLQTNLTSFWNNWHMTLTQWFRAYFFNPLTRSLRKSYPGLSAAAVILLTQISTMVLIGLWHGITLNFILWGLWHGIGLFVQNRWSEWIKDKIGFADSSPGWRGVFRLSSIFLTFHYVVLGWIWFALPDPAISIRVFLRLFGLQ